MIATAVYTRFPFLLFHRVPHYQNMQFHFVSIVAFMGIFIAPLVIGGDQVKERQNGAINDYGFEDQDKIIGLKHFEVFLRDLEKKIADWTKTFRETVVDRPNPRHRRQADPNEPPRKLTDWIVVQDLIEGAKFVRKQVSDFIDRATRFITGDQFARQAITGPYVPIVKELREYMILLQRRLTVWSAELDRVFRRPNTDAPMLLEAKP